MRVELVSRDTGLKRQVDTGPVGVYSMIGLPMGTYDLKFSCDGFRRVDLRAVQLSVGQTRTVEERIEVGALSAQIEVSATVAALKQSNAKITSSSNKVCSTAPHGWRSSP